MTIKDVMAYAERLERHIDRLESDLRELRSTVYAQIIATKAQGAGLASLLMEEVEPEETEEQKRLREEQQQFLSFLGKYQGDGDIDA